MSETAEYLINKKALESSIQWYVKTIQAVAEQQITREEKLKGLRRDLYLLESNYYKGNK